MTESLVPPLPANVDLRHFRKMPLDVERLRDSDIARSPDAEGFRCAVLAWCVAWHQVPAASLPDDDRALADLLGLGRTPRALKEWLGLRETALRGFVKCADGRLYHPVVAGMALDAWHSTLDQRWKTECARLKKQAQRTKQPYTSPDFILWITLECPLALPYLSRWKRGNVPEDKAPTSHGQPTAVPRETASNGMEGKLPTTTTTSNGDSGARPVDNPRPNGPTSTPGATVRTPRTDASLIAEGKRKGIEAHRGESMEAFEARVRHARP